jgi:ribonuclease HII
MSLLVKLLDLCYYAESRRGVKVRPTFAKEQGLWQQGYRLIAGIDEVGRGPLAGPVVAAAVILPCDSDAPWLLQVRDSKRLRPRKREFLSESIREAAAAIGIGAVSPETIDEKGIVASTRLAMRYAVEQLAQTPDFLLIDAITLPDLAIPQEGIIRGDALSLSIAAASIIAKVARDRLMIEFDSLYPGYGFSRNKGYATPEHLSNLKHLGPCPIHRKSFRPVRELLERDAD